MAQIAHFTGFKRDLSPAVITNYTALKAMRDAGQLTAGQMYRITDYTCTTTQTDTQSAGHAFDIVVTALDERTLDEKASAIQHAGDTYFKDCKLEAWELKYCIDNDTTRFAWADETNGKGVIYYMKDEWDNECPYDFKNIQFKRYKVTSTKDNTAYFEGRYVGYEGEMTGVANVNSTSFVWVYTFSYKADWSTPDGNIADISLTPFAFDLGEYSSKGGVVGNHIGSTYTFFKKDDEVETKVLSLNNIVVEETFSSKNHPTGGLFIDNECSDITIGAGCFGIKLGYDSIRLLFGNGCFSNTFGNGCSFNTFGNGCFSNTFGNDCFSNTFGNGCSSNTFGNGCSSNTFGNGCFSNTFGNDCSSNTFGNDCSSNTFGDGCFSNTFGNDCFSNTFGNDCSSNTFGNDCFSNTFMSNASGNEVNLNYIHYFILQNGVKNVKFQYSGTPSSSRPLENVIIKSGVAFDNLTIVSVDATKFPLYSGYQWTIAKNSNDEVKQYCEEDLIQ